MDSRLTEVSSIDKSKLGVLVDTNMHVSLFADTRILPHTDIDSILDTNKRFVEERNSCNTYRILGQIKPLISNVLFDIKTTSESENTWETLNTTSFLQADLDSKNTNITYAESIKKNLKEIDGWFGYFDPNVNKVGLCNFIDMSPNRESFSFNVDLQTNLTKNWDLTLTYPYSSDTQHNLIKDGLLVLDILQVTVGGKPMTGLITPVKHNLEILDMIVLSGTNKDGEYEIKRLADDTGVLSDYIICLDVDNLLITENTRVSKIINGVKSEYYFRLFKTLNTQTGTPLEKDDYEIFKLGFSETIYSDDVYKFIFNEEVNTLGLLDNLGRPISEIYLTITNKNTRFTNEILGIEMPYFDVLTNIKDTSKFYTIPSIHGIHTTSLSKKSFIGLPSTNQGVYYGDLVEYNNQVLIETSLSEINARINTLNREILSSNTSGTARPEGYYYTKHNKILLREFSEYIEYGDSSIINIPEYATKFNNTYSWRDLLDRGQTITTNYPYTNGHHYIYSNFDFEVKRQDPFGFWGLYHKTFPADPLGNAMDVQFNLKYNQNVC